MLSTIAYAGGTIDTRTYDAGGRLSSETLGNGQVVTRAYLTGDNLPALIANAAVGNYTYGWDANKNKTSETITGSMSGYTSTMAFDDQNRLTSWNRSSGDSQAWTLSAVNNWQSFTKNGTAEARTHGPAHEVLTVGAAAIQHDSRGNMTLDEFAIARTYDADGKVSQATVPADSTRGISGTHTYQYDVLNRRVRKTVGGSTPSDTVFVHTGEQITSDYAASAAAASPTAKYLWGSYIDELACRVSGAGGSTKLYPHRNQQYSTTALTDQTGTVVERYAYTPYGDLVTLDPTTLAVRTTAPMTRYTYTGREHDAETGSYHFRARPYSATLGRFPSRDPIMYPDGANTYAGWFAVYTTDPSGLATLQWNDWDAIFKKYNDANHTSGYPNCIAITRAEYFDAIIVVGPSRHNLNLERQMRDKGCVGLALGAQRCGRPPSPGVKNPPTYPDDQPNTTCYPINAQPANTCKAGEEEFRFIVEGPNQLPAGPGPYPKGVTPADRNQGDYNYETISGNFCIFMDHGQQNENDPQTIFICTGGQAGCPTTNMNRMLCITCRKKCPPPR